MTTETPKKLIFDWRTLDAEIFRGRDLTFPIAATVVLAPEFDAMVIAAMDTFPHYGLVQPEEIKVHILYPWERGENAAAPFNDMEGCDLGLRLHYIEGNSMDYVLRLQTGDERELQ